MVIELVELELILSIYKKPEKSKKSSQSPYPPNTTLMQNATGLSVIDLSIPAD